MNQKQIQATILAITKQNNRTILNSVKDKHKTISELHSELGQNFNGTIYSRCKVLRRLNLLDSKSPPNRKYAVKYISNIKKAKIKHQNSSCLELILDGNEYDLDIKSIRKPTLLKVYDALSSLKTAKQIRRELDIDSTNGYTNFKILIKLGLAYKYGRGVVGDASFYTRTVDSFSIDYVVGKPLKISVVPKYKNSKINNKNILYILHGYPKNKI